MASSNRKILNNPALLFLTLGHREWFNWMSDKTYLKIAYVYLGEMAFYITSGLGMFTPVEWNLKLGEMIKLSSKI